MGTYVTTTHLAAFRTDLNLSGSTDPTETEANSQIVLLEAEFEAAASWAGYTVPLVENDSPKSFRMAKHALLNALASWCYRNTGLGGDPGDESADATMMWQHWLTFLSSVRDMHGYLVDATVGTGGPEIPVRRKTRSLFTEDATAVDKRAFTRGMST